MDKPIVVADKTNRRVCIRGEELLEGMAVHVVKEHVGQGWQLVIAEVDGQDRFNVYFLRDGNPRKG